MSDDSPEFHLSILRALVHLDADTAGDRRKERHKKPVLPEVLSAATNPMPTLGQHPKHIAPLLDALAAICVQKEGQAYAVTMSLLENKVALFVAENEPVAEKVTDHLKDVWNLVIDISRSAHDARPLSNSSSYVLSGRPAELVRKLKDKLYEFSHARLTSRLEKRWSLLDPFLLDWRETLGKEFVLRFVSLQQALSAESPNFRRIAGEFDAMSSLLASKDFKLSEKQWEIREHAWMAGNVALVNQWRGNTSDKAFAPHRCITKLFLFHTHVKSIISVALSQRLSAYLSNSSVEVVSVQPWVCNDIPATPTMADIDAVIRAHVGATDNIDDYEAKVEVVGDGLAPVPLETVTRLNAHCECSLLAYHLQNPNPTPLQYIGISKLCFACRIFLELYNRHAREFGQKPFGFKGEHGKLYTKWVCLRIKASEEAGEDNALVVSLLDKVRETMVEVIKGCIIEHVKQQAERRVISDSTVASREEREDSDPEMQALLKEGIEVAAASKGLSL
ncbi:hypothetical protein BOTBODRAFT_175215 [Botryobasidium botryosum FD-172 SS1]|uniref:Uncharacterized protein n=1 Tax=Botryobasidium botryosum (strain FD-172 SS1) TaxID=930990 RepID=A0A067ME05_BOTB1|nr:hypothetical protein BOTBODRAFT_175215 [Botryobasidium botryosum FD-172 SS1]